MSVKRVSAKEASEMMTQDGWEYVDVRSIPEFEAGHPEGAYNIPILQMGPGGMAPNPDFLRVFEGAFSKDAKLILGCQSGGRSLQAAQILQAQGYSNVVDQRAGFAGAPPMAGSPEPGWRSLGLPVATQAADGRAYATLAAAAKP